MAEQTTLDIPLSIGLLNRLRKFEHNAHTFNQTFLEEVDALLAQVQKRIKVTSTFGQYSFETLYLLIHYYFSLIYNLEAFVSQFKDTIEVVPLNFASINSTNIFNIHSLTKALQAKRLAHSLETSTISTQDVSVVTEVSEETHEEKSAQLDVHFLQRFKVQITQNETKANSSFLFLSFDLVELAFTARGRYDLDLVSIICTELNKAFDLELYPHLLHKIEGNEVLTIDFNKTAYSILNTSKATSFQQEDFDEYVKIFLESKNPKKFANVLSDLEDVLYYAQFKRDKIALDFLERLLICLLGHKEVSVREQAVIFLNILYDGIDWQLKGAYKGRVSTVGNEFKMEQWLEDESDENSIGFLLYAFSFDGNDEEPILSWHKPEVYPFKDEEGQVSSHLVASIDLGNFPRAGFYDWKFVKFQKGGKVGSLYTGNVKAVEDRSSDNLSSSFLSLPSMTKSDDSFIAKPIHGRYIVHPKFTRDLQIHEVFAENPEGIPGPLYKGSFVKIKDNLANYAKEGINCVYLMGALESDYKIEKDPNTKAEVVTKKAGSNPMAITDRTNVSTYLGGGEEFNKLMSVARDKKVKIVLDYVARISSARPNKRYRDLLLYSVDNEGKLLPAFGGEGRSVNYEDTIYLNYRKKEAWDLLINEAIELISKYKIDGLHLDDAQCWPNLLEANISELERNDTDGTPAYTPEEIFYGKIVIPKTFTGYWMTEAKNTYPSPMLIKFCKAMWQSFPDLILIGEAWGGQGYEDRETQLIRSGVVPRLFKIPPAMTAVYGQYLHRDGKLSNCEVLSVNSLRSWYESFRRKLPTGSIVIQSTTDNCWPYPAYLFRRGVWSFIDLIFFLPDIPITFMGEISGHAFRCPTVRRIQTQLEKPPAAKVSKESRENILKNIFDSVANYLEPGQVKTGACICERADITDFWNSQKGLLQEIGPQYGFDLSKIGGHYEHRRQLRMKLEVLRTGKLVPLLAEHSEGFHSHVLSFARVAKNEMALIATNFNEFNVYFSINLRNLKFIFDELGQEALEHCVVKIQDHIGRAFDEYYTVYELLYGRIDTSLKPHSTLIWGASITTGNLELYQKTLVSSMERIKAKIARNQVIEGNEVTAMITHVVRDINSLQLFANNMGYILRRFLQPHNVPIAQIFNSTKQFRDDPTLCAKLFAFCHLIYDKIPQKPAAIIQETQDEETQQAKRKGSSLFVTKSKDEQGNIVYKTEEQKEEGYNEGYDVKRVYDFAREVLNFNKLGPVAFITPELGRWSTTGGLGVMVDELSIGLEQLGEEVICISPYYERNRKGETGYLEKDPDNIQHIFNMEVNLGDGKYVVGVHSGVVKGVTQYFLHNPFIFPHPYADGDARFTIQQLSLMAKASLEVFCVLKKVPSLIVTNDWFTALVAAYPKHGHFGEVFKGTKFLHIVHNLDPTYEGRLYPNPHEGFLEYIHNLPSYLFVDPYWKDRMMNPSRCAILSSDQWATVSPSYKSELLSSSPLASILKNHPQPFAFPNGIPKEARLQKIINLCGNDHLKAKEILQKKYFKMTELDDSTALFAFVGRITQQKGVHLILESAEHLMREFGSKIQFIIGGMVNLKDPYGSYCAGIMYDLTNRYPNNFWSSPTEFFTDGSLVNVGADFALMPSLFEPGGIVQHEFFVGSTPVIAFQTGGLKDSVFEFDPKLEKGNGFNFMSHKTGDLIYCIQRAMGIFKNKAKYQVLRKNAFESTIDVDDVARAWNKEFHRLFNKTFMDPVIMKTHMELIDKNFDEAQYEEKFTLRKVVAEVSPELEKANKIRSHNYYLKSRMNKRKSIFTYKTDKLPRPKTVKLVGSFDNWEMETPLNYDHIMGRWTVTKELEVGEYFYKFVVDDKFVCSDDDPKLNDLQGNINNFIQVL